jgi:peptidoglycan/LPS O-acetylase OafA/YrhL
MSSETPRSHLHGLDGLRAIACIAVFFDHVEQYKDWLGLPNHYGRWMQVLGRQGVELFFVLSGYLITYRMFLERRKTGSISIPKFYLRRALRIWPLYYTMLGVIFFVIPFMVRHLAGPYVRDASLWYVDGYFAPGDHRFLWYAFLFPHVAYFTAPTLLAGGHCWSIGVEEQFYLVWPLLMWVARKRELAAFVGVILLMVAFNDVVFPYGSAIEARHGFETIDRLRNFADHAHFEAMAIGGCIGWAAAHHQSMLDRLAEERLARVAAWMILPFAVYHYGIWHGELGPALLYAFTLAVLSHGPKSRVLESRAMTAIGVRSYAIYLVHPFAMFTMGLAFERIGLRTPSHAISYVLACAVATLGLAAAAHRFIEKPALAWKDRLPTFSRPRPLAESAAE